MRFRNILHLRLNKKMQRTLFWTVLILCLLFGASQISATPPNASLTPLIISEFMATNGTGLVDEDGDTVDWIEIYNKSGQPVNLGGWALTNDPTQPARWMFPDISLGSREYLVVFASGKNRQGTEPGTALHTNFRLNKQGGYLGLYNVLEDRFMDELSPSYPQQFRDVSYGRYGEALAYGYLSIATPGGPNDDTLAWRDIVAPVAFSVERGFYDAPFEVTLSNITPEATIRYTTDGSQPTESNGTIYTEPIAIETTTTLRAAAFNADFLPSPTTTHSYIFLKDVLKQPDAPAGFPASWGTRLVDIEGRVNVSAVPADYGMAPDLVDDPPQDTATFVEDLQTLPTLSLVMDRQSFADLHTHFEDSQQWEQPVSVEWIEPDGGRSGFQIDAGIRPYVAAADSPGSPKRSFRLLFKGTYGATELLYPLFPTSSISEFDTVVLLAGGDGSFANPEATAVTYARNEWLRESQAVMSGLGAHGTFVQLYINGLYWGLYNVAERPDDAFLSSYLGSDKTDWFIATQAGPQNGGDDERADNLNYLFTILDYAARSGVTPEQQAYLAEPYAELAAAFDPAQFSDYLILNWYAGLENWPAQNWYAGIRLQDIAGRGRIFAWDNYQIFQGNGPTIGFDHGTSPQTSVIQPLFETMLENPDFRMQLADRLYKHLFNNGALTDANATARWRTLTETIEPAISGEAARWGDAGDRSSPLTPEDWRQASNSVLEQIDGNATRLLALAREAGYYPPIDPPVLAQDGGLVQTGFRVEMALPDDCENCDIYYTINGSDPRLLVTGDLLPTAIAYDQPAVLNTSASIKARVLQGDPDAPAAELVWSALHEATFNVLTQDNKLRFTEIMYNPLGGDDYEFIELQNTGSAPVNVAGMFIDDDIRYLFPPDAPPLGPGNFLVLVSSPEGFARRYPDVEIAGAYEGHLSNKGGRVILYTAAAEPTLSVTYNDDNGWPVSPDGRGDSLTLTHVDGDPNDPRSWQASSQLYGSPGAN